MKSLVSVLYGRKISTELKRNLILNAHNLSYPNKSFFLQKRPWWGISNMNCLAKHKQEVKSGEEQSVCCPLLSLLLDDHHGRKAGDPNINCYFILSVLSPVLRSRFWKGSVLMCFCKYNSRNLIVLRKLQALETPCLRLAF